ncbi:MAG: TauD/TfdA family dioxygenase [Hyphomicrobiales bacterium]|nr:TauD/TfdA family dioxygenase [Hyphomicrobiales bacterium]
MSTETNISVRRLSGSIGAEISGVSLSQTCSNQEFDTIHRAFLDHSVLVFRDQQLEPDELAAFSKQFGRLEQHVLKQFAHPDNPDVFLISNVKEQGKPIGAIRAGQYWHTDCSYMAKPTMASILNALEVPSYGGDTMFASMAEAYDELSETMQKFLAGLTAVHDYTNAYDTFFAKVADRPPLSEEERAQVPPVTHPVIRTHPETGRKVLFVNPGFTRHIVELSDGESRAVLDYLFEHARQPHFIYRHRWEPHDLVIWDNRSTWHLAIADYDMKERRHFHRTSIAGDAPH